MTIIALGCYTQGASAASESPGSGVSILQIDCDALELIDGPSIDCESPTYLAWHPEGDVLYVSHETSMGMVSAYAVSGTDILTLELDLKISRETGGADPCHLTLVNARGADQSQPSHLLVSNYSGGSVAVFALSPSGDLEERTDLVQHTGASVHPDRQTSAHVHQTVAEWQPSGRAVVHVVDLGLDLVRRYALSGNGVLSLLDEISLPPGSGPRQMMLAHGGAAVNSDYGVLSHIDTSLAALPGASAAGAPIVPAQQPSLLHDDSDSHTVSVQALVVGELDSQLYVTGGNHPVGSVRTTQFEGANFPAHLERVDDLVLVTNRGADTLAFIRSDDSGLALVAEISVGHWPRHAVVVPGSSKSHVVVSNQLSNSLTVVRIDRTPEGATQVNVVAEFEANSPACVAVRQ